MDFLRGFILIYGAFLILLISVIVIEIIIHKGREKVEIFYSQVNKPYLENVVKEYFHFNNFKWIEQPNRIIGIKGKTWLMGETIFDINLIENYKGTMLLGIFYIKWFWKFPDMKFGRIGWYGIIPRRRGWKLKNEFFNHINYRTKHDSAVLS
jgi:hypothetical protein